jgi:hypothetical protein
VPAAHRFGQIKRQAAELEVIAHQNRTGQGQGDLGLDPKKTKTKKLLEMAVTVNRFGEIEELDAGSIAALGAAKKRVEEEREPYQEIKEDAVKLKKQEKESELDQEINKKKGKKGKKGGREKTSNPLRGGSPGSMMMSPGMPERLFQQNHCGIYRMERSEGRWIRIGDNMPVEVGDIGFPIELHPRDPDTAWVFPMDGTDVWPRTSPSGRPALYVTRDAGTTWRRQDRGLPPAQAWLTVLRQAMAADAHDPVGLYFGTTSGEIWASTDEGASWTRIAEHLPEIYSVECADPVHRA